LINIEKNSGEGIHSSGTPDDKENGIALDDAIHPTETYPPQDLAKWLTIKAIESRNHKWKKRNNEMKERKKKQTRMG
jgi:hypothetical protein